MSVVEKAMYSVQETAKILGVSGTTVRRMIDDKIIVASKVRGQWRIPVAELNKYLGKK